MDCPQSDNDTQPDNNVIKNISKFKETIVSTSKLISIFTEKSKELESTKADLSNANSQISNLKTIINSQQKNIEAKILALSSLKAAETRNTTQISSLKQKVLELSAQNSTLSENISKLKDVPQKSPVSDDSSSKLLSSLKTENDKLKSTLLILRTKLQDSQKLVQSKESLLSAEKSSFQKQILSLKTLHSSQINQKTLEIEKLQDRITELELEFELNKRNEEHEKNTPNQTSDQKPYNQINNDYLSPTSNINIQNFDSDILSPSFDSLFGDGMEASFPKLMNEQNISEKLPIGNTSPTKSINKTQAYNYLYQPISPTVTSKLELQQQSISSLEEKIVNLSTIFNSFISELPAIISKNIQTSINQKSQTLENIDKNITETNTTNDLPFSIVNPPSIAPKKVSTIEPPTNQTPIEIVNTGILSKPQSTQLYQKPDVQPTTSNSVSYRFDKNREINDTEIAGKKRANTVQEKTNSPKKQRTIQLLKELHVLPKTEKSSRIKQKPTKKMDLAGTNVEPFVSTTVNDKDTMIKMLVDKSVSETKRSQLLFSIVERYPEGLLKLINDSKVNIPKIKHTFVFDNLVEYLNRVGEPTGKPTNGLDQERLKSELLKDLSIFERISISNVQDFDGCIPRNEYIISKYISKTCKLNKMDNNLVKQMVNFVSRMQVSTFSHVYMGMCRIIGTYCFLSGNSERILVHIYDLLATMSDNPLVFPLVANLALFYKTSNKHKMLKTGNLFYCSTNTILQLVYNKFSEFVDDTCAKKYYVAFSDFPWTTLQQTGVANDNQILCVAESLNEYILSNKEFSDKEKFWLVLIDKLVNIYTS
ncbi:hypothetical protein BB558_000505 [Smittium angustum]|uniref:Uncharacterized protein n=1 Tax=Smittium angustum TaxID=133377 RepID=A0A2U1IUK3_SMIAN|nr:hypothetical protein BB558_007653 [Smittium angustum]PWA03324.1 hypothetical protein BB558_000505 [Smittium angustum]